MVSKQPRSAADALIDRFDPDRHVLVFTHIPKCGGTSMHEFLAKIMPKNQYVHLAPDTDPRLLTNKIWGIGGHFSFGGAPAKVLGGRTPIYFTMLRHPGERVISYYRHLRARPDHPKRMTVKDFDKKSPLEAIKALNEANDPEVSNLQSRFLAGSINAKSVDAELALTNLQAHYQFFAPIFKMNDLCEKLLTFFESDIKLAAGHANKSRGSSEQLLADLPLWDYIICLNQLDLELYKTALQLYTERGSARPN